LSHLKIWTCLTPLSGLWRLHGAACVVPLSGHVVSWIYILSTSFRTPVAAGVSIFSDPIGMFVVKVYLPAIGTGASRNPLSGATLNDFWVKRGRRTRNAEPRFSVAPSLTSTRLS